MIIVNKCKVLFEITQLFKSYILYIYNEYKYEDVNMVRIINNNWSPIPFGWGLNGHYNCGGNNWLQKMLGYQMLFGWMQNMGQRTYVTPPQQQQYYNPYAAMGLQLGRGQQPSYEDRLEQHQNEQDFVELKNSYKEFKFTSIGGEYQASLKSDRTVRFSGSTPLELMEQMNAYIDENPDAFKTKPTKVETDTDNDGAGAPAVVDDAADAEEVEAPKGSGGADAVGGGATPANDGKRRVKEGWYPATAAKSQYLKNRFTLDKLKGVINPAGAVAMYLLESWGGKAKEVVSKDTLKAQIIAQNPSVFDNEGKLLPNADMSRLDVPTYDWAAKECKKTTETANNVQNKGQVNKNGHYVSGGGAEKIVYNGTQNNIYKKNGSSTIDDDAIFVIGNLEYTLQRNDVPKKLDFWEITDMRTLGVDYKLIDPKTGQFNEDENFWKNGKKYEGYESGNSHLVQKYHEFKFSGTGALNGCVITWDATQKNVVLKKGNQTFDMNKVMTGAVTVK